MAHTFEGFPMMSPNQNTLFSPHTLSPREDGCVFWRDCKIPFISHTSKVPLGKPLPFPVFPNRPKQHCSTHTHREKGFQTLCHNRNSKYLTLSYMTALIIDTRKETIATQTPGIRVSVPMATMGQGGKGGLLECPHWLTPDLQSPYSLVGSSPMH